MMTHGDFCQLSLDGYVTGGEYDGDGPITAFDTVLQPPVATMTGSTTAGTITVGSRSQDAGYYFVFAKGGASSNGISGEQDEIVFSIRKGSTVIGGTEVTLVVDTGVADEDESFATFAVVYLQPAEVVSLYAVQDASGDNWDLKDLVLGILKVG